MARTYQEDEFNIWPTYADISFALVLILIFAILGQYLLLGKILEINEITKEQQMFSNNLKNRFPDDYGKTINDKAEPQFQKISFTNRILFDSGSDVLRPEGKVVLQGVAELIKDLKEKGGTFDEIQIRGHTDDRPILDSDLKAKFPTNWELSSARATAVVRFFVENCGLQSSKHLLISAQGYSKFDFIAENIDDESRSLNRRIELIIRYPLPYD